MPTGSGAGIKKFRTEDLISKLMHSATTSNYFLSINVPGTVLSHIQRTKNPSVSKISLFPSYFFSFIANFITFIFLTEPITNELEGLFRGEDFKNVLHGENIKKAYESKLYEKSLDKIVEDLENR